MPLFSTYFRLMRLHKPTGIWLLLWPCWWALALATHGNPPVDLLLLFGLGAVVMRGAGCIVNDMVDRDIDRQVARTRDRPLASGAVSPREAVLLLLLLLAVAFVIALQLKLHVLLIAAFSLLMIAAYPFMKRLTWWPQAFLGLTFNMGALMGFVAVKGHLTLAAWLLYIGCNFWTLGYDTIYAHQDKDDDERIGVRSSALFLGDATKRWVSVFYALAIIFWFAAGWESYMPLSYALGMVFIAGHFIWQVKRVNLDDAESCMKIFRSNTMLGWIFFAGTGAINSFYWCLRNY